jgi:HD-GYP domain-containing protein (c-di-GMP phosphodiesterase class II)
MQMVTLDPLYDVLFRYTKSLSVALGYRDLSTRLHSERVRDLAVEIGQRHGLSESDLVILKISASFHDIGKIGMPDHILLKPSQFDEDEWRVMRQHAEVGEKIMLSTELSGSREAAVAIRHHHEYFNGGGYPDRIAGEAIPICSRIISIADSYDAMAVTRSYHRAKAHSEIMDILEAESGQKHDPELMSVFREIIESSELRAEN